MQAVLTVGADGGITIIDPDAAAAALPSTTTDTRASLTNGARLPPFRRPSPLGGESYTAGRWADSNVFVAVSRAPKVFMGRPSLCTCLAHWVEL
jgi:hypothetical protein